MFLNKRGKKKPWPMIEANLKSEKNAKMAVPTSSGHKLY